MVKRGAIHKPTLYCAKALCFMDLFLDRQRTGENQKRTASNLCVISQTFFRIFVKRKIFGVRFGEKTI